MPKVKKIISYKVIKNGHVTHHRTKAAAKKKTHGTTHHVKHHRKGGIV